jgi:serine phosphatase RsbU (regulator of sigma subunit)
MTKASVAPSQPGPRDRTGRSGTSAARLRVLLVEDDDADAFLVQELLDEANAPIDLTVAATVAQAAQRLDGVDCVLLDLGLPDAQGLDALRRLRALADDAAICVLTGLGDEHLGVEAVSQGAQDYLIKGQVDGILLSRSVRYAVERKRADINARRLHLVELQQQESARLERGLLPQPLMHTDKVRVGTFYQPGRRAMLGGDFFDVVQTSPDQVRLMVGDVCGHGVDEAALGVELRVAWRALTLAGVPDDKILRAVEQVLISERNREEVFATLASVTVNLDSQTADVRLAGHPPPLLISGGDATVVPAVFGPVLGVFDNAHREASHLTLAGTDWALLLYTDGLIEGRQGAGRLDVTGLQSLIATGYARDLRTAELPAWLAQQAEQANGGPLADDVAMLILRPNEGTS